MEIRIGKEWVIQSSGNAMNIILAKVPQDLQDSTDPIDPIRLSQKFYYSTIFGAITGVFKLGIADSEARTFQDLEKDIHRIAKECQKAFDEAKEPSHG